MNLEAVRKLFRLLDAEKTWVRKWEILYYLWKRMSGNVDLRRLLPMPKNLDIDRPIFLLGSQGGGLTFVSRMLRRNPSVVSITGNHHYWTGADEMAVVYSSRLPHELRSVVKIQSEDLQDYLKTNATCSGTFAAEEFFQFYRRTDKDFTSKNNALLRRVILETLRRHAPGRPARFIDKSQIFAVKVPLLHRILQDSNPKFILIVRNMYASTAIALRTMVMRDWDAPREDKVELVARHLSVLYRTCLSDLAAIYPEPCIIRFEDILVDPKQRIRSMCAFAELEFNTDMLPQPYHVLPFGTRSRGKWYPIRHDVNTRALSELSDRDREIVHKYCGDVLEQFEYAS